MLNLNIYKKLFVALTLLSFAACDKKGNPLPSIYNFKCEINGIKYKDQMPSFLLTPGAIRTPYIREEKDYYMFASDLSPEIKSDQQGGFYVMFRIPRDKGILLNQSMQFESIKGKEVLEGLDNLIYLQGNTQFVSISDLSNKDSYGKGTVTFSSYDRIKKQAQGRLEVTFPALNDKNKEIKVIGDFLCVLRTKED